MLFGFCCVAIFVQKAVSFIEQNFPMWQQLKSFIDKMDQYKLKHLEHNKKLFYFH